MRHHEKERLGVKSRSRLLSSPLATTTPGLALAEAWKRVRLHPTDGEVRIGVSALRGDRLRVDPRRGRPECHGINPPASGTGHDGLLGYPSWRSPVWPEALAPWPDQDSES